MKTRKQVFANRNEVFYGPAPACMQALRKFSRERVYQYSHPSYSSLLVKVLARRFKMPGKQIIVTYGAEGFLEMLFNRLDQRRDIVLLPRLHYGYFSRYLRFRRVRTRLFDVVPRDASFVFDVDDCIRQCRQYRPCAVIIASPNNPTGNSIAVRDLVRILGVVPRRTFVVLDEAYWGFARGYREAQFLSLLRRWPNLIILRTFSKYYALAGLRIGFALCGTTVPRMLEYQRSYLGMSRVLEEVAITALRASLYYRRAAKKLIRNREWFVNAVRRLTHFVSYDSFSNFVYVRMDARVVGRVMRLLRRVPVVAAKFIEKDSMRMTIGSVRDTRAFVRELHRIDEEI